MMMMIFYRLSPDEESAERLPSFGETLKEAEKALGELLLARFLDQKIPARSRPYHARLVAEDGTVLVEIRVNGSRKIERVKNPR